ncbi:IBR domain containing protein [Akanthomyces lecanii RCEF 1005]|uniref:IBR domain containing protein n=1 Tax=Akanthomyces lecanii RCEF 1005 TaxID=1081108 RepID=A0A168G541_CORDF|nr:IBR domain containing protein [Akanthomyces lecanii RCEF 1005]
MEMDEEMDPATLNLILELQFQDAQDAASRRDHGPSSFFRGRQRQRQRRSLETLDRELAMDLQQHEFDEFEQRRRRRATAPDIRLSTTRRTRTRYEDTGGDDFDDDPDLLAALAASRIRVNSNAGAASSRSAVARHDIRGGDDSDNDDDLLAALAASHISARTYAALAASRVSASNHVGPSTSSAASAPDTSSATAPECVSCMEAIRPPSSAIHLPCSHRYCAGCMAGVLGAALDDDDDESRFPARCCAQPLPVAEDPASSALLPANLVARYRARQREHGARNRTYCRSCGQFIPPESVRGNRATCIWCEGATCAWCKEAWHGEGECPADGAALETLRIAEERGWKRCPECRTLVELSTGCNHMSKSAISAPGILPLEAHVAVVPSSATPAARSGGRAAAG